VRTTRARVRGLTARITNMLKGYPGEPSEKGGRICIAAPAGGALTTRVFAASCFIVFKGRVAHVLSGG